MRISYIVAWALMLVLIPTTVISLSACGQTGDLYLPDSQGQKSEKQEEERRDVTEDGSF